MRAIIYLILNKVIPLLQGRSIVLKSFVDKGNTSGHTLVTLLIYSFMQSGHKCKAAVITCIDFRFVTKIASFLDGKSLNSNYDLITVPGASLNLDKIMETIETSIKLHEPDAIYVFDHEDCGAYGENNSRENHTANLAKAKKILSARYPQKEIKTYIAGFNAVEEIN